MIGADARYSQEFGWEEEKYFLARLPENRVAEVEERRGLKPWSVSVRSRV